jgi:amino acid adenylation domain-containing protein
MFKNLSIIDCLHNQSISKPNQVAFEFITENDSQQITYKELAARVQAVGEWLKLNSPAKARGIIFLQPGFDYIIAFFGCLYAGLIAVPAYPPRSSRHMLRLQSVLDDADPHFIITNKDIAAQYTFKQKVVAINEIINDGQNDWNPHPVLDEDIAFLQYTSGSTGEPKGVMVTHGNIIANCQVTDDNFITHAQQDVSCSWLPPYHDMGLIGGIIAPIYKGMTAILMSPTYFLQQPLRWLEIISDKKVTMSGAPNFAYDLCVKSIKEDQVLNLDLSSLKITINGAEPILADTLSAFNKTFGKYGLSSSTICPGYGMAETTLIVSIKNSVAESVVKTVDKMALEQGKISLFDENNSQPQSKVQLVSCGHYDPSYNMVIVDPATRSICPPNNVGEIWINGPSVAKGYWNKPELTQEIFHNTLPEIDKKYLRTGDLGFIDENNHLFITGRLKDLIIFQGRNLYPQDIEATVYNCHPDLIDHCCTAFTINHNEIEQLVIVQEVKRHVKDYDSIYESILKHVLEDHNITPFKIIFIKQASMPKTSSGKLQRRYTRQLFLENQLMVVTKWEQVSSLEDIEHTLPRDATEKRLLEIWSDLLKIDKIGIHNNFFTLGGQSIKATQVIARIRAEFGVDLPLRGIFENPTVAAIAKLVSTAQEKELFYDIPAILPTRIKSSIPLSFAQQRLWFLDHLINNKAVYNIPVMIKLEGQLNIDALESSFQQIIERHGALRTSFKLVKGEAEQVIDDRVSFCLHKDDLSKIHTKEEKEQKLVSIAHDELTKVFDLNKSPLIRGKIVIFSKTEFVLLITMHHTISDGWSVGVLAEELSSLYNYYAYGSQLELADLPVQYTDYTLWQRSWLKGELLERQLHYWQDKLKNLEALNLPFDKVRPTVFSYAGKTHVKIISKEVTQELKVRIEEQKVTLFMILTAITQVLLYRYSQQEDIIIGTAVSGRRVKELEGLIGFFVNILPIRSNLANNPKFDQFLKETKETVIGAYTNQDVPFEQLIDHLNVSRDLNRHPIFQVLLSLQNTNLDQLKLKNVEVENVAIDLNQAKFDLAFIITEKQNELIVSIEYSSDLFYEDTIARLAEHFEQLLTSVVKDPQQHIDNLSILTNKELQQTLVEWNDNDKNYPQNKTIHQLFEEQVEKTPDNIALVYEDTKLTYRQLNERANQLAHYLVKHYSVKPDSLVALCLDRSKHMLIAILAVLKAGGAYLPMDSTYPDERIKHIMQDSASNIVLTNEAHKERLDKVISQSIVPIDSAIFQEELANLPTQNPGIKSKSSHLAYVIYTSGTTGNPKGVMIEHKGVVNLAITQWHEAEFFSGSEIKSFLGYANYVFDAHVWEFYTAILNGHILHIINNDIRQNDVLLRKYIEDNYINIALLPPVLLDTVNLFTLDLLLVGGDKCSKDIYDYYRSNGVMLVNAYGPSEVTVYASSNYYQNNGASNIGAPIANAKCYVLSPRLTALPIGAIGELYIGGVGLARGYINQSELTAEKFIQNPFQTEEEKQEGHNSRIYKTGDLVRWRADGNLEYVGRNDSQVKIRGYRIELGEIESVLLGYDGIKHSVVLVKEPLATDGATTDNKYLIGYYVSEERLKEDEILTYLQSKLPQYMVPSILVHLEKLPLTINGKLDTKALPEPQFIIDDNKYLAPRNDLEKQLCKIWAEVLIIPEDKVGIRDDFFRLGGNSILAIRLISKLNDALNASVNVSAIFQHSTI